MDGRNNEYRREFIRYATKLQARYSLQEMGGMWESCTVFDVSRKGMGIQFHPSEEINVGTTFHLLIDVPDEREPFALKGVLRWVERCEDDYIGGIEFTEVLDEIKSLIIMLKS